MSALSRLALANGTDEEWACEIEYHPLPEMRAFFTRKTAPTIQDFVRLLHLIRPRTNIMRDSGNYACMLVARRRRLSKHYHRVDVGSASRVRGICKRVRIGEA